MRAVAGQDWGADKQSLKGIYVGLMRSTLDYGCIVYESASSTLLKKLDVMQAKALRLILGAVKTTPIAAVQVETSETALFIRQKLAMAYWINLQGQRDNHPVREVLNDCWEILNATGKGFAWKIKGWVNEDGLDSKPWLLTQPEIDIKLHENRREMVEAVSINTYVNEYINSHYSFLQIYTDGSKCIDTGRTG